MRCRHPLRWLEDRREHLTAAPTAGSIITTSPYADRDGTLRESIVKNNSRFRRLFLLSLLSCLEAAQVASIPRRAYPLLLPHLVRRDQ
jgi:carbon-monoxide dehydrogenase large subunit